MHLKIIVYVYLCISIFLFFVPKYVDILCPLLISINKHTFKDKLFMLFISCSLFTAFSIHFLFVISKFYCLNIFLNCFPAYIFLPFRESPWIFYHPNILLFFLLLVSIKLQWFPVFQK